MIPPATAPSTTTLGRNAIPGSVARNIVVVAEASAADHITITTSFKGIGPRATQGRKAAATAHKTAGASRPESRRGLRAWPTV
jgi:hypothetical protein